MEQKKPSVTEDLDTIQNALHAAQATAKVACAFVIAEGYKDVYALIKAEYEALPDALAAANRMRIRHLTEMTNPRTNQPS
jgi:Ser/Thr protein kinase RdoA (MazF antagonist)